MKKKLLVSILLILTLVNVSAEIDLSSIEAQERAQIISELTYRLDTKQNCSQTLNWDDSGSGADLDGYFFIPKVNNSEFIIGGHASGKRTSKYHCVTTVSEAHDNPKEVPKLLVAPVDWKRIWKDSGSGATKDGSFWQAIPPDDNYKCIGSVSQLTHKQKPQLANYRCIHNTLTEKIETSAIVWSDKGTGADQQVSILNLPNTGAFIAIASRVSNVSSFDLKKSATSTPDPKRVEEILAKRIAPIKVDIEMKTKVIQEQKEAAKKVKQEEIAATEEKKKQEAAAVKKALAEKKEQEVAEQRALVERKEQEAQKLKEEQQARIAKAKEEKAAAEEAKQKEVIAKQPKEEAAKNEIVQSEPAPVFEKSAELEQEEMSQDFTSANETKNESKGLNDILIFFLKIFGMMIGGVIIFMVAFKILFGKKDK